MTKHRVTVTLNDGLYKLAKVGHANMSLYIEQLIKTDVFKEQEHSLYDSIVQRLIDDGYIAQTNYNDDISVIPDYQ